VRAVCLDKETIQENCMKELTLEKAALAWAQGKRVEAAVTGGDEWLPIDPVGECLRGAHSQTVFGCRNEYSFRLASEPPAKRYRPWTPEEVPVGALVRTKGAGRPSRWMIVAVCSKGITTCGGDKCVSHNEAWFLETTEHSIDNGKTWLPCGVEVEA
jgi:hypothetical protein